MDADHRGGWTKIFGGKASEPETSRPVEKRIFCLRHPYMYLELSLGRSHRNFVETFCVIKLESLSYRAALFRNPLGLGVFPSLDRVSGTLCLLHYVTETSQLYSLRDF